MFAWWCYVWRTDATNFKNGETTTEKNSSVAYVRCVRGNNLQKPEFTIIDHNDTIFIHDTAHNLLWPKTIGEEATWEEALEYCKTFKYGGEQNWRLPNINELASFLDYSLSSPASEFPGLKSNYFWSSTSYTGYPSQAWVINSSDGTVKIYSEKLYTARVICVK